MSQLTPTLTLNESRALELLGSGVLAEQVAAAIGVTPSYISQLLSREDFAALVAERRFANLQSHNIRDGKYDELEDELIEKLKGALPLMYKPLEIMRAITVVNGAKRRGQSAPEAVGQSQQHVTITLPTQVIQKFTTNIDNQVIKVGTQDLTTIQSGTLLNQLKDSTKESQNVLQSPSGEKVINSLPSSTETVSS